MTLAHKHQNDCTENITEIYERKIWQ